MWLQIPLQEFLLKGGHKWNSEKRSKYNREMFLSIEKMKYSRIRNSKYSIKTRFLTAIDKSLLLNVIERFQNNLSTLEQTMFKEYD